MDIVPVFEKEIIERDRDEDKDDDELEDVVGAGREGHVELTLARWTVMVGKSRGRG